MIRVVKRDGRVEVLDISKIQKYTSDSVAGLENVSQSELEVDAKLQFRDLITTQEIQQTLISTAIDKIDIDRPDWTFVASRLFLYDLYHRVNGYNGYPHLKEHFIRGEKEGRIVVGLKDKYDLDDLSSYIKPERDLQFNYLGIRTLYDRYLLKDGDNSPIELPQQLFMGVAMFLAQNEFDCQLWAKKFYDILSKFEVMAATPTLSNARTPRHQLSSCFVKGTKVRTIDGYKSIDKIIEGDLVLTHNNRFMKVYELFKRDYARNLITLNINGLIDDLSATEEHPILSIKKDDIKCIRKLGSCLKSQRDSKRCFALKGEYKNDCEFLDKKFSSSWNKIEELNVGDFVSISYPKHIHKKEIYISDYIQTKNIITKDNKIMFKRSSNSFYSCERSFLNNQIKPVNNKIELSKDFMLLIGYFLAEGHIAKDMTSITFTFASKETLYIQETKKILEDIFDVNVNINPNRDNSVNVYVHSKIVGLFFDKLIGTGFDKKLLNNDLLFANPEVQKYLLIGAIRGDGCALKEGYQLTMSNKRLIKQLFEISLRCGLSPYMKRDFRKHKLATIKASHLKIGVNSDKYFILSVNKNIEKINFNPKASSTLRYFWLNNEYFMKIIEREDKYLEDKVYNIEVEEDHSYSVSGVNVHNCYIGSTADNIEGIFDAYKEMALLSKFGGGIGWDWSLVRGMGSFIDGHKHAAGGIVPFLKIANDVAIAVDQLGCVAKNSFVRVLQSVETDKFNHNFRREYQEHSLNRDEIIEIITTHIKNFTFKYGKLDKSDVYDLLKDYITGLSLVDICTKFNLSRDQYKRLIGKYKKINKGIPYGFIMLNKYPNYAIHQSGVIINLISLKLLNTTIDRKGYVRVSIGKKSLPLHKLLVDTFLDTPNDIKFTIDHIDNDKLNNSLDNFKLISNEDNISKGWESSKEKRIEMSRVRKHLSHNFKLKGDRRNTQDINIIKISTKVIPISEARIGDLVESFNIELNKVQYKKIEAVHDLEVKKENQIKISFKDGYIITSKWHPMAIKGDNGYLYKRSDEIKVGEFGVNYKGEADEIIAIDYNPNISPKYMDLTVQGTNNYFASTDKSKNFYLTHNTRKGAIAVYIEPWHIDIKDFIDLKKNSGEERRRAHDLFPALWLNDIFMQRIEEDATWTLFDPYEVPQLTKLYGEDFNREYIKLEQDETITKNIIRAKDLWKTILRSYFESGNPFLTFKDSANRTNPNSHTGVIRSSNLCTEIMQNTEPNHYKIQLTFDDMTTMVLEEDEEIKVDSGIVKLAKKVTALDSIGGKSIWMVDKAQSDGETAVCNLASINLSKINRKEDIDRVVPTAIRMLDNVIDLNFYPLAKVKKTNQKSRAIGLGVMGEAQMLAENQIEWGSDKHFNKIDEIMEAISYNAIDSSSNLAIEKGTYPTYDGSSWSQGIFPIDKANSQACNLVDRGGLFGYSYDWEKLRSKVKQDGMRNGYLMAIAPTSSISILTGTTQAIEPIYKRKWYEENLSGLIPVVAPNLSPNNWHYYKPCYELDQRILIKAGAIRQKWIDQGQSLNIFVSLDKASGKYLNDIYMSAWKYGLKSTYYLRSQSPEAIQEDEGVEDRSMECVGCQ